MASSALPTLQSSYSRARDHFAYFKAANHGDTNVAFVENAGGSQVPACVVAAISEYMTAHYAQLGAGYSRSNRASRIVADAHRWVELLMNARGVGEVILGPSTSQLAFNLASAYADTLGPSHSVVLQEASHESVVGPWVRLAARTGCTVHWWRCDPGSGASDPAALEQLLGANTRVVVLTHVSNLLGEVLDLASVVRTVRARAPNAHVLVDGVAYAPHRAIDVAAWDVDWYIWSAYKVYGPHMAVMYGKRAALEALLAAGGQGPNHYWIAPEDFSYKFELGGPCHEGCAGLLALQDYLAHLIGVEPPPPAPWDDPTAGPTSTAATATAPVPPAARSLLARGVFLTRAQVAAAFDAMTAMEEPLQARLLPYLAAHPAVQLVGPAAADVRTRVPTISFVHTTKGSRQLAAELQGAGFAVRCGHMYARRLVEAMAGPAGLLGRRAHVLQRQVDGAGGRGPEQEGAAGPWGAAGEQAGADGAHEEGVQQQQQQQHQAVEEGVVRVSLLHYNTPEEVEGLIQALERIL